MFETFDLNDVKLTGTVISMNTGLDGKDRSYLNIFLDSKGKKYSEVLHVSFFGDYVDKVQREVKEGDKIFISAKLIGKKVIDAVNIKLVGNFFYILK